MTLLSASQKELQLSARNLAEAEFRINAEKVDRTEEYPWDNISKLNASGFMGMSIPKKPTAGKEGTTLIVFWLLKR